MGHTLLIEAIAFGHWSTMGKAMQELINTKTAARLIGITPATLENWRVRGEGPPFHKTPGRTGKVLYDPSDIAAWRQQRRFSSTADAAAADHHPFREQIVGQVNAPRPKEQKS